MECGVPFLFVVVQGHIFCLRRISSKNPSAKRRIALTATKNARHSRQKQSRIPTAAPKIIALHPEQTCKRSSLGKCREAASGAETTGPQHTQLGVLQVCLSRKAELGNKVLFWVVWAPETRQGGTPVPVCTLLPQEALNPSPTDRNPKPKTLHPKLTPTAKTLDPRL